MNLGQFIDKLKTYDSDLPVKVEGPNTTLVAPRSYRGYYDRLAFEPCTEASSTVSDVLAYAKYAVGKTYYGYKGGLFLMDRNTLLHVADYGCCGEMIVGLRKKDGVVWVMTEEE